MRLAESPARRGAHARPAPLTVSSLIPYGIIGLLVVALGAATVLPNPTIAGGLGLVVVAICLMGLYRVTMGDSFAPAAVTFWTFVGVWVGFAPLLQIRDDDLPWPDLPLYQHYVTAQVILLAAVATFAAGYFRAAAPIPSGNSTPRFAITVEKAALVTAVTGVIAAICLPVTGGVLIRFTTRDDFQNAIKQAGITGGKDLVLLGLLSILPAAASAAALILCLICWRNRAHGDARRPKLILGVATAGAVVLNVIFNNPLSANRFASFGVMMAALLALVRFERRWLRIVFSATMLIGLTVIYPLSNSFRNERLRGEAIFGMDAYYNWDFDGFQQTVNSVHHVAAHGHTWGHHLVSALLFWVPRSLWEDKAIAAGNAVANSRGYKFQNLSLPFWAEIYLEFTLVGVVVLFYFYGRLAKRLDRTLAGTATGLGAALAVALSAFQIGLLRGPLGAQIPFVAAALVILCAGVIIWRGRRRRTPVAADEPIPRVVDPVTHGSTRGRLT